MPGAVPRFATQLMVVVPQPEVTVRPESPLVVVLTVRGPVPDKVNITGAVGAFTFTLCVPPEVIVIVGAAGLVTVDTAVAEATRLAPSATVTVIFAVPT